MIPEKYKKNLLSCQDELQVLFNAVGQYKDIAIIEGHRGEERQNKAFKEGKSDKQWPDGKHNKLPSWAVDVAPCKIKGDKVEIDWNDTKSFYDLYKFVSDIAKILYIDLRWGGDWDRDGDYNDQRLMDLVHYELVTVKPVDDEALLQYANVVSLAHPNAVSPLQKLKLWISSLRKKNTG